MGVFILLLKRIIQSVIPVILVVVIAGYWIMSPFNITVQAKDQLLSLNIDTVITASPSIEPKERDDVIIEDKDWGYEYTVYYRRSRYQP